MQSANELALIIYGIITNFRKETTFTLTQLQKEEKKKESKEKKTQISHYIVQNHRELKPELNLQNAFQPRYFLLLQQMAFFSSNPQCLELPETRPTKRLINDASIESQFRICLITGLT